MARARWLPHAAWGIALVVLTAGLTTLVLERRAEHRRAASERAPARAAMPFPTTVSVLGPTTGRVGGRFAVSAAGYGMRGGGTLSLYDGARRVATVPAGSNAPSTPLTLPALSAGQHVVTVVAEDADGRRSHSPATTVDVAPAPGTRDVPVRVDADPGETVPQVAARFAVDPSRVRVAGRVLPSGAIGGRARVSLLVAPDTGSDLVIGKAGSAQRTVTDAGGLRLKAEVDGCAVTLVGSGASDRISYFRGGSGTSGWLAVGSGASGAGARVDRLGPGAHVFFARSGGQESAPAAVTLPEGCGTDLGWTGEISIVDGILTVPEARGPMFVLLRTGEGQPWVRVPASQDDLLPSGTRVDVTGLLPKVSGTTLDAEAWAMQRDVPLRIGTGRLVVPDGQSISSVIGQPSALTLSVDGPDGPANGLDLGTKKDDEHATFHWTSASASTDQVVWQVLSRQLGTGDHDLAPPELLATGTSVRSDDGGSFTVDLGQLPGRGPPGAKRVLHVLQPPVTITSAAKPPKVAYGTVVPAAKATGPITPAKGLPGDGDTVWVRVLDVGTAGPVAASPTAFVRLAQAQSATTGVDFAVDSLSLEPGRAANPAYVGCAKVTVPWQGRVNVDLGHASSKDLDRMAASAFYPRSGTYCPRDFPPAKGCDSWLCDVGDFLYDAAGTFVGLVVSLYSVVSYVYNGAIDAVVKALADLNPVCAALGAASDAASKGCKSATAIATRAAITAVMTFYGFPPSLPTEKQLAAVAEGDLAVLAVELMKQAGVPCDDIKAPPGSATAIDTFGSRLGAPAGTGTAAENPCLAVAQVLVKAVAAQAKEVATQTTAAAGGLPYLGAIDGFSMVPDDRGQVEPLKVDVRAHTTGPAVSATGLRCVVQVYDPAFRWSAGVGPGVYRWLPVTLTEDDPVDGKGSWSGHGVIPTSGSSSQTITRMQGLVFAAAIVSKAPSPCRIPVATTTATVPPPDS